MVWTVGLMMGERTERERLLPGVRAGTATVGGLVRSARDTYVYGTHFFFVI